MIRVIRYALALPLLGLALLTAMTFLGCAVLIAAINPR